MNYQMVKRLIQKDWYLHRRAILWAVVAGVVTTPIMVVSGTAGFILGLIVLVTILIGGGAYVAVLTTVMERKEKTLAFVMSLPVSYREFTAAKILGNVAIFLVLWVALVLVCFVLIAFTPALRGTVPYVAIMAVEILVSTCLVIAVAVISESQGWANAAIIVGNLALNGFGYYVAHIEPIGRTMWGTHIHWSTPATVILLAEFAALGLLMASTFLVQSKKTDFL